MPKNYDYLRKKIIRSVLQIFVKNVPYCTNAGSIALIFTEKTLVCLNKFFVGNFYLHWRSIALINYQKKFICFNKYFKYSRSILHYRAFVLNMAWKFLAGK